MFGTRLRRQRRVLVPALRVLRSYPRTQEKIHSALNTWLQVGGQKRNFAMPAAILNQMDLLTRRYDELAHELSHNDGSYSSDKITNLSIELAEIEPKVMAVRDLRQQEKAVKELDEMIIEQKNSDDPDAIELRHMAAEERRELLETITKLENYVVRLLLPRDEADDKSSILEIRAGTGGDEACLFAADILKMYQKVAIAKGWKFELMSISETDLGGVKECVCSITGRGAFGRMKFESGVHRVQRVPVNDVRIHTSAVAVVVLPEAEEVEVEIDPKDLRIDVYRASGAGGQHVNTTESAVRITHIPTGIVAAVQDERSQHQNKAKALKILRARVFDGIRRKRDAERQIMRNSLVVSGDRSERVRTYNFPQSRVSDHRVNVTVHGIERMLNGELLDEIVDALVVNEQNNILQQFESL
ncbi:peptide chain release factor 1 [Plasmopara halstedii]|uniref:Peptide chain release factor 1 n=1 Tax=Plasmopara halstedii TaxID=4781 RepID=A0A0P1AF97_PLAHL|nr:peptide chain release factor 1 [Plasmopara halstedii]CEG39748.1 peptide chain release factor 1 [Plasmopara halstedii]|eukprot:XP_024576117.1 peptide chain release factor 1 [Plasmopara halstedii]